MDLSFFEGRSNGSRGRAKKQRLTCMSWAVWEALRLSLRGAEVDEDAGAYSTNLVLDEVVDESIIKVFATKARVIGRH